MNTNPRIEGFCSTTARFSRPPGQNLLFLRILRRLGTLQSADLLKCTLLLHFVLPSVCFSFIPPVPHILRTVLEGRRSGPIEITLKHRFTVPDLEIAELEERILFEKGKIGILWRGGGLPESTAVSCEKGHYSVGGEKLFPNRSSVFLAYFGLALPESFQSTLIQEQFLRRDQCLEFKPNTVLEGDPSTWNIKEARLRHSDIFLKRIGNDAAIAVAGIDESSASKTVFFDRDLKKLRRLEWREGQEMRAWNFFGAFPVASGGIYPRRLSFEINQKEVVVSDLISVRFAKDKSIQEFRNLWKRAEKSPNLPSNTQSALRILLSYR